MNEYEFNRKYLFVIFGTNYNKIELIILTDNY
jgi:hypothetical protein